MFKKILIFGIILTLLSLTIFARSPDLPSKLEYGITDMPNKGTMEIKELSEWDSFLKSIGLFAITPLKTEYTIDEPVEIRSQLTTWNLVCDDIRIVMDVYRNGVKIANEKSNTLGGQTTNRDLDVITTFPAGTFTEGTFAAIHYAWCNDDNNTICTNNVWHAIGSLCNNSATTGDKRIATEDAGVEGVFSITSDSCPSPVPPENCFNNIDDDCDGFCDTVGSTCTDGSIPGDPACDNPCANQPCENGNKECGTPDTQYRICVEQLDGCFDWGDWKTCTTGVCNNGQCDNSGTTTTGKTCYKCVGETLDIKKDQTTCPTGYSETKPTVCGSTTITPGLDPNDWEIFNITLQDKVPPSKDIAIYFCIKNTLSEDTTSPVEVFYLKKTDALAPTFIQDAGYLFSVIRTGQVETPSCKVETYNKAYNITIPSNSEWCGYADPTSPNTPGEYIVVAQAYNKCGDGGTATGVKKSVQVTSVVTPKTEICDNILDDDFDGNADADDSDCVGKGKPYIEWNDITKITETQARESGCNTDDECINDNCLSLDYIDSKVSGTSKKIKRWYWWDRDGLCMEEEKDFQLMQWIEEHTGLTGTYAYVAIGGAVLAFLFILNMLLNPPRR